MIFNPFDQQEQFLKCNKRIIGAFAGKRGGKTEVGAIKSIIHQEQKPCWVDNLIDPFLGVIIAPTWDMLRRLSIKKFISYSKGFIKKYNQSTQEITWHDDSMIYGLSGEKPQRVEGVKASWIWIDEVFQVSEELFLECRARVADTQGYIFCTGSLGTQYNSPKNHWVYKYFKENRDENTSCFEWSTVDNPYFPKDEIISLKEILDPRTYRQMFTIDWDVPGTALVYGDFSDDNEIDNYIYNPGLETYCSIDWGFAHEMACLYFQYDRLKNIVYLFDEIVSSKMTLELLYKKMSTKPYRITSYICDIAGKQTREQTGISNIEWFKRYGIIFKHRRTAITYGIPIIRSYIKDGAGRVKFFVCKNTCPKSLDGIKNYSYPVKDGVIISENPIDKDDDCVDAIRYFFVNILDERLFNRKLRISHYA